MVRAISSAIENRAFLNNSKAIGSWMTIMALSPSTAGASRWHHPLLMGIILHYLNQATQHWDTMRVQQVILLPPDAGEEGGQFHQPLQPELRQGDVKGVLAERSA